jgi:hypothetical protein
MPTLTFFSSFKGKRFILAHSIRGYILRLASSIVFWAIVRQNIMVKGPGGAKLLNTWWPGSKEERGGGQEQDMPSDDQFPAVRPCLLKFPPPPKKCHQLETKFITHDPVRNISFSNHNILPMTPKGTCSSHNAKFI